MRVAAGRLPPPWSRFLKKSVTSACFRYCGFSASFSEMTEVVVAVDWDWFMYFSKNLESSSTINSSLRFLLAAGKGMTSLKDRERSSLTTESLSGDGGTG